MKAKATFIVRKDSDIAACIAWLRAHLEWSTLEVTASTETRSRSIQQNRLMWLWNTEIGNHLGLFKDEVHYNAKRMRSTTMLNSVNLIGNLGADPEMRYTPNGTAICNFRMATSESYTDKDGQKVTKTEWHRIVAFNKLAEVCGKYLHKGKQVYIGGKIQTCEWEDRDGNKRYTTEIVAQTMKMLGGRSEGGENSGGGRQDHGGQQGYGPADDMDDVPF